MEIYTMISQQVIIMRGVLLPLLLLLLFQKGAAGVGYVLLA